MTLVITNAGSFPVAESNSQAQRIQQAIADQLDCGVELVTDGQVGWHDPVSHFAGQLTGIDLAEQGRYLDTSQQVRQPRIRGPFAWAVPVARPEYERAQAVSSKPVKPVLTGALTLARHSMVLDPYYRRDFARLVGDYNEAVVCEVRELAAAGAAVIQIDEPVILRGHQRDHPAEDWRLLRSCWRRLASAKGAAKLALNIGWGDPAPLLEELFHMPADIVALDFTANPRMADIIGYAQPAKSLQLGLVNGLNAGMENGAELARMLEKILSGLPGLDAAVHYVSPNAGLGGLPRDVSCAKLGLLAEVCGKVVGTATRNSVSA